MYSSGLAHYSLLITDYPGQPPAPAAPPAPAPTPAPPPAIPLAFSVVTRASVFGIVGSALGTITLATVTCSDSSATIRQSITVPGLTFSYAGSVLTVAGTPTGNAAVYRVVVSYIASSDGATVLGSSEHEVTIANAAQVLTVGTMVGATGKAGDYFGSVTLCPLTSNYDVDITAAVSGYVPRNAPSLTDFELSWSRATRSGSFRLNPFIPSMAGAYTLSVVYSGNGQTLGSSTHQIVVAPSYQSPAPAPAPASGPSPPSPSAPPAPTPAPAPGAGADPYYAQNKFLLHFASAATLGANQVGTSFTMGSLTGIGIDGSPDTAANLAGSYGQAQISGCDGSSGAWAAECMVNMTEAAWLALSSPTSDQVLYTPCITYLDEAFNVVWTLGFASWMVNYGAGTTRVVSAVNWSALNEPETTGAANRSAVCVSSTTLPTWPNRYLHLATCRKIHSGSNAVQAVWLDGTGGLQTTGLTAVSKFKTASAGYVRLGGVIPPITYLISTAKAVTIVPLAGCMDEARGTAASRYSTYISGITPATIPPAARDVPWPNY